MIKIVRLGALFLAKLVVAGGAFALLTAPPQRKTDDQQQLQQELQENAAFLEGQESYAGSVPDTSKPYEQPEAEADFAVSDMPELTIIGDSVMLGAAVEVQKVFPESVVDAKESRQAWDGTAVVEELRRQGNLGNIVVVALGSNGSFSQNTGQEVLDAIGSDCTIYWSIPYGKYLYYQADIARILDDLAKENENLTILDWPGAAEKHPEWFYDDGMHLNESGQEGYAAFLLEAIGGQAMAQP